MARYNPYNTSPDYEELVRAQMLGALDPTTGQPVNKVPAGEQTGTTIGPDAPPTSTAIPGWNGFMSPIGTPTITLDKQNSSPGTYQVTEQDKATKPWLQDVPFSTPAAATKTGWGFDSPTGGRKEFGYTPGSYEGDIGAYSGYEPSKIGQNDSIKYVWLEATRGLPVTVESIPEIVSRLNAQGIPAKQTGYDTIDFGLGEGPVDVLNQTRGGVWDWMPVNAPSEGGGGTESAGASQGTGLMTADPLANIFGKEMGKTIYDRIMELINLGGVPRSTIMGQLNQ